VNAFGLEGKVEQTRSALAQIVGEAAVLDQPRLQVRCCPAADRRRGGQFAFLVRPGDAGEVQRLVAWANRARRPLVPLSSGEPHFRADTVPLVSGAVAVDLSRLDRIRRIDRRNRLALIEPGVTYSRLLPELSREGLRLVMPLLPRANKSVLAALLEREPLLSPRYQWSLLEPLRSLEIIWGNGERLWSGGGAFRGEKEEDWRQGLVPVVGPGPGQLDFYKFVSAAQGSMGIVTWASVKCEVLPRRRALLLVPAREPGELVEFLYRLLRFRLGDELFLLNAAALALVLAQDGEGPGLRGLLPPWTAVIGVTGGEILPDERVEGQCEDIREQAREHGLQVAADLPGCPGERLQAMILQCAPEPHWRLRGGGGDSQAIFFLTTLDKVPAMVSTMQAAAGEQGYPAEELAAYIQPVHQGVGCHCEFILPAAGELERLVPEASRRLQARGAFFSRPYGEWAQLAYGADPGAAEVLRKVKRIFDPNNVLNPGKLCF
jgi:FAD/FMN-containing dehydrogenase